VIIPGINDIHAPDVAAYTALLGADIQNCMPMLPVAGTAVVNIPAASADGIQIRGADAGQVLPQLSHCSRCRADAAGIIGCQNSDAIDKLLAEASVVKSSAERPYVAVASMEGLFVNRHLGEAAVLWIYTMSNGKVTLKEQRATPVSGSGDQRWKDLAELIDDCTALLVSNCGSNPKKILENKGLRVITSEGLITETAGPILEGREIPKIFTAKPSKVGCGGTGGGCA
jgi:nitrogen fixation protein NifB